MDNTVERANSIRVLVTGATGAVGPRVIEALREAGYRLRTLSLDPPTTTWPNDIETRIGDISNAAAVQSAMQGVDAVVHLASLLHIINPSPQLKNVYSNVNVGGTRNVMNAAVQADVSRVIYFSTIAVYGDTGGCVLNEEARPNPKTFYEKTKLDAEAIVLSTESKHGQRIGTVLRLGAVYGSRIKGNYRQLLKALAKHKFIPIGEGHNRRTLVYDKDVANATVLALTHPAAGGKIFNVSDGEFHTIHNIISAMCSALGRKTPTFSLPYRPVRFIAGVLEDLFQAAKRRAPITRAAIDKFTEDTAVDSGRIRTELGFRSRYKLEEGWKETVQEMRRKGEL
jgi:nucleoside-diphosphate-sugar epimerase